MKAHKISELYQYCVDNDNTPLLPPTEYDESNPQWYDFWSLTYDVSTDNYKTYDLAFNRKFNDFIYYDLFDNDNMQDVVSQFWYDIMSIFQVNQKKYQEMYRIFLATDQQMPFDYNYDMTETYGKTKTTTVIGSHTDTIGQVDDTHKVAPFNSTVPQVESQDITAQRSDTIGGHTDTVDGDAVTNTRKGNIGVQTAGDIARIFTNYWTKDFKFVDMIFNDICKELLFVGD